MLLVKLIEVQMLKLRGWAGCSISSIVHQPESHSFVQHYRAAWEFSISWEVQQYWQPQQKHKQLLAHGPRGCIAVETISAGCAGDSALAAAVKLSLTACTSSQHAQLCCAGQWPVHGLTTCTSFEHVSPGCAGAPVLVALAKAG